MAPTLADRIASTARPAGRNSGRQTWRDLLFLHWPVPVESVQRQLPAGLEVDTFEGQAWVALVPFLMRNICPPGWPRQWGLNFCETNVRTYVHHQGEPGVYFFSLDANSRLAVWIARWGWALPYYFAKMEAEQGATDWRYCCQRGAIQSEVHCRGTTDPLATAEPGSLEFFLLERYRLFVARQGRVWSGRVYHAPYRYQRAELLACRDRLVAAAGWELSDQPPALVHFSPGVDVEVFRIEPCP